MTKPGKEALAAWVKDPRVAPIEIRDEMLLENPWISVLVICLGFFMIMLDTTYRDEPATGRPPRDEDGRAA